MCGIVGIIGHEPVAPLLIDALKRLEYRGYDSAGCRHPRRGRADAPPRRRQTQEFRTTARGEPLAGTIGIGHTRWATHGRPTENNAHPHATDRLAVVHNGIIENFAELRRELQDQGVTFSTETDTEVIAHLVSEEIEARPVAGRCGEAALPQLRGAFALGFLFADNGDLLIGARQRLAARCRFRRWRHISAPTRLRSRRSPTVSYPEDGDWVVVDRQGRRNLRRTGKRVEVRCSSHRPRSMLIERATTAISWLKEILRAA